MQAVKEARYEQDPGAVRGCRRERAAKSRPTLGIEKTAAEAAAAVASASIRFGWSLAEQPRSFRTFIDHACRYWLEVRSELGISGGDRSSQDVRDIHVFVGAAASAYAAAPLSCVDLSGQRRDECLAVAGFARLLANETALAAILGPYARCRRSVAAKAVAAFHRGYEAAVTLNS
jgi:hypothetical protein